MSDDAVLAIGSHRNNAELIAACARLGYLTDDGPTWDGTYGLGRFWTLWQPRHLCRTDADPRRSPDCLGGLDATASGWIDAAWRHVVLDPPYKLNGTSTGRGGAACDDDYGVGGPYTTVQGRLDLMAAMLTEAARVLAPKGTLLYKCQDQVVSGRVVWQTHLMAAHAATVGLRLVDQLHLVSYRAQPPGRRQLHARRNYSTLLVFRKDRP